jgi:hypothetical protein
MKNEILASLLALLMCALPALAGEPATLTVGAREVRVAMPDGYVRTSVTAPTAFAVAAAGLPPSLRLVETFIAESDLKRILLGSEARHPYLQVQVLRDAEALDFTQAEWAALLPMMAQQVGATDLDAHLKAGRAETNARMSKAAGGAVEMELGRVGAPHIQSQDDGVLRYALRVPLAGSVNGQQVEIVLAASGSAMLLGGKLVMLNGYLREQEGVDAAAQVGAFLDTAIRDTRVLND